MKTDLKSLLENAKAHVPSFTVEEARTKLDDDDYVFIDVREQLEFENDGAIPGSVNVPRGMLEFILDQSTPYYNPIFESSKNFIFYCKSGGRSLLASQRALQMGLSNVWNMEGGFLSWNQ